MLVFPGGDGEVTLVAGRIARFSTQNGTLISEVARASPQPIDRFE